MLHIGLSVILQDVLASMRYHIWVCGGICVCTCGANILVMCICICIRTICKWYSTSGDTIYTIISGHVTPYLRSCGTVSGGTYLCTHLDMCAVLWGHHAMGLYTSEEVRRHASYPGCVDVLVDVSLPYVNGTVHLVIPSVSPSQVM